MRHHVVLVGPLRYERSNLYTKEVEAPTHQQASHEALQLAKARGFDAWALDGLCNAECEAFVCETCSNLATNGRFCTDCATSMEARRRELGEYEFGGKVR